MTRLLHLLILVGLFSSFVRFAEAQGPDVTPVSPPAPASGSTKATLPVSPPAPSVELVRVPEGGIQPQAVVGSDGTIHVLYYKGDAKAGDLFYVKRGPKETSWSTPRRANSQAGSAVAIGNDRGGQISLGSNGIVHVAWNGSGAATPKQSEHGSPMLYSRLVPEHDGFEPQRNMMTASGELDGGGSVAADEKGNVYVVWHGLPANAKDKAETSRRVFVSVSTDDGKTFAPEVARSRSENGACGCCGLKAAALPGGVVLVLYRAAGQNIHRDMHLMRSNDAARTFTDQVIDAWQINACPMTTASITSTTKSAAFAWETLQDIRWAILPFGEQSLSTAHTVGEKGELRKYPSLALDESGCVLVAWTEGMAWNTGGKVRWSLFDVNGKPIEGAGGSGGADGVPVWSLVAAIAKPGGGCMVLY